MDPKNLDNLTEEALDAWEYFEPPADFAATVVAEASRHGSAVTPPKEAPRRSINMSPWTGRGILLGAAAAAVAALAVTAIASLALRRGETNPEAAPGTATATATATIADDDELRALEVPNTPEQVGRSFVAIPLPEDLEAAVDRYATAHGALYGDVFGFHGTIVIARDGEVILRRSYGAAIRSGDETTPPTPHRPDTRLRLGTLSQQLTATAILLLADRGALSLDDPLHRHLPDYPALGEGITIRHLLAHTSGIPSFTDDPSYADWRGRPHDTAALLTRFSGAPLEFPPGSDFDPSNSGYAVLGAVIEAASGVSYAEFMRRELFEPLGMGRSAVGDPPPGLELASGYLFTEDETLRAVPPEAIDLSSFGAAGNLVSTADDLSRWALALFEGELLAPTTREVMLQPSSEHTSYGLGWILGHAFGQEVVHHPGGIDGYNAAIRYYRGDRTLIVVVANNDVIDSLRVVEELGQLIHRRGIALPIERPEIAVDPGLFERYTGRYLLTEASRRELANHFDAAEIERISAAQVIASGDRLFFAVPGHGSKWMHGLGTDTFFFKDPAATIASFTFTRTSAGAGDAGEAGDTGEAEADGPAAGEPADGLLLRQGPLDIRMRREITDGSEPLFPWQ